MSVVLGDEREREVDAGGDSRGRPHVAVVDVDGVGIDGDTGVGVVEQVALGPVGRRASSLEQPRGGEHERTGAHRGDPARVCGQPSYLVEKLRVGDGRVHVGPAGDHQRVDGAGDVRDRGRGEVESTAGPHRPARVVTTPVR